MKYEEMWKELKCLIEDRKSYFVSKQLEGDAHRIYHLGEVSMNTTLEQMKALEGESL